jgi:hypothetical protein
MGARPSTFRKGGGFLNEVDGLFVSYEWTDAFNGQEWKPGKKADGKPKFHSLYCLITAKVDGAEEEVQTSLFAGGADDYEVSDDGKTLKSLDGGPCSLGANTGAGKFFASFVAGGFPEANLSDDDNSVNYEPMEGSRVRFVQRDDLESTRKLGKRKSKDGTREFNRQDLVIETVYALPGKAAKSAKPAAKSAKPSTANGKAGNGHTDADAEEIEMLTAETILGVLAKAKGGTLLKDKLRLPILQQMSASKNPNREEVYKLAGDDDFLAKEIGWAYDQATKVLSLPS